MRVRANRWSLIFSVVVALTVGGCNQSAEDLAEAEVFARVERRIADRMRDPAATQFRNVVVGSPGYVCGEVNAKNAYGGYVGFTRFISDTIGNAFIESEDEPIKNSRWIASCDAVRFPTAVAREQFLAREDSLAAADRRRVLDSLDVVAKEEATHRRRSEAMRVRIDSLVRDGVHPFIGWRSRRVMFSVWCVWDEVIPHSQRVLFEQEADGRKQGFQMAGAAECGSDRR